MSIETPVEKNQEEKKIKKEAAVVAFKEWQKANKAFLEDSSETNKNAVNVTAAAYREAIAAADEVGIGEGEVWMEAGK